jgi:CubicO group peptidase (beta-lactamase class C family)
VLGLTARTRRFAEADRILRSATGERFTAAALRVERRGTLLFERGYGSVDDGNSASRVDGSTAFDLASLTKVFVATAALRAVAASRLELDEPLAQLVPEWSGDERRAITTRALLAHTSGMHSGADYRLLLGENVERYALLRPLAAPLGERVIYSDLGFIALGVVLSRAAGTSLATELADTCAAIDVTQTRFRPPAAQRGAIPATEDDGWRGRLRGEVHDEKAYLMNGVAGHAGLFGTARDAARLADVFLAPACGRAVRGLPTVLAAAAIAEAAPDAVLRRGLGWALKTTDENSCGQAMSRATFGHTGFTGTCMWADPERDLSIVLLTNAVYYGRNDIRDLRAAVCDAVVAEIESL